MNKEDFEESLAPILDPAFRLAMTMLNDRTAAEDAVQEAALKAWRNLGRLHWGSPLRPWFLAIVANECRSARRSRWWRVMRVGDLVPRPASQEVPNDRVDLARALERLPRHHLMVLSLYYHLDLPVDEIAEVLRCSEGAVRQRLHRALAALRPSMAMKADA